MAEMLDYGPASGVQPGGDIFPAYITDVGITDADGFIPHGWRELRIDPTSLNYVVNELGRTGTTTQFPAYDLNKGSFYFGKIVYLRLRGWSEVAYTGGMVYDILACPCGASFVTV